MYCIQYNIVWCVKYRRKVLFGDVDKSLKEIILKIASDNNFEISEMETD
ncbi:transposase, partial [Clostridium perfringens]|nr:transposase [Clostridium perfringens]MDK0410593.1 transposase [Clostridium perfringens]MDK0444847.1 transposase [Clostridium perfringens]MDK0498578.1 transposase [Clostridium perfringens]MDK0501498.1 transposase [Clostridium perfringens]